MYFNYFCCGTLVLSYVLSGCIVMFYNGWLHCVSVLCIVQCAWYGSFVVLVNIQPCNIAIFNDHFIATLLVGDPLQCTCLTSWDLLNRFSI